MNLDALFNAIIVQLKAPEETQHGNIIVPDLGTEKNPIGTVIAVGPGHELFGVGFISTQLKVGETVILPTMGFTKFQYQGEDYLIGKENEVLAKIND